MLAALLVMALGLGRDHALTPSPRFSSIILAEGGRAGLLSIPPHGHIEMGFDWASGEFRVTARDRSAYRTGVVSREWFEDVLADVLECGLEGIRPQTDPGTEDVYGFKTHLAFFHGDFFWVNQIGLGCAPGAGFEPSLTERQTFLDIVRLIRDRVEELDLQPGCLLDSGFVAQVRGQTEARALLAALEHALRSPQRQSIDLRQIYFQRTGPSNARGPYEVRFRWRESHDPSWLSRSWFSVRVDGATRRTTDSSVNPPLPPTASELSWRRAYLEEHPHLHPPLRRLIAEGWLAESDVFEAGGFSGRWPTWSPWLETWPNRSD